MTVDDSKAVSSFTINTAGMTGFVAYCQHSPYEFEAAEHYLKDSDGSDVEHNFEKAVAGGHSHSHDHMKCSCESKKHGWKLDCNDMQTISGSIAYLDGTTACSSTEPTEQCKKSYHILQAHHDHCMHDDLPTDAEVKLHLYESKYEDCFIKRQFNANLPNCNAVDCNDDTEMNNQVAFLEANCGSNCSSVACKYAIQYILMAHDTCEESQLPHDLEVELHHHEGVCEAQLCNTGTQPFDPMDEQCDHADAAFEWAGTFSVTSAVHPLTWTMAKKDGAYADPSMRVVIIPTTTPNEETMHCQEATGSSLINATDCVVVSDGGSTGTIPNGGKCFEMTVDDSKAVSSFTINTAGMTGFVAYCQHSPYEFEAAEHYLKDGALNDIEHVSEESVGGHGHSHSHGAHDKCICKLREKGLELNCAAKSVMESAFDYLKNTEICWSMDPTPTCREKFLIVQAHHDHCLHDQVPTEIEQHFHYYEAKYDDCLIQRQYDPDYDPCPGVTCSDTSAMQSATDTLMNGCGIKPGTTCTDVGCKAAFQLVLMVHDTCTETELPHELEIALHDAEPVCESAICNTAATTFDPTNEPSCPAPTPTGTDAATTKEVESVGIMASPLTILSSGLALYATLTTLWCS